MHDEAGVLQQRVQLRAVQGNRAQSQEGIGGEQAETDEGRAQQTLHRQHPRLQSLAQGASEEGDGPAVQGENQHPQQHGPLVAAP